MTKFFIPNLLEFMYDCFSSRTKEFLFDRLSREELKKVDKKTKIKSFVENASLEEKQIMLSKLGFGCATIIWDKEKVKTNKVHEVLISYLDVDQKDLARTVINDKIFATVSTDLIRSIQVVSKVNSSKVWKLNKEYLQLNRDIFKTRVLVNKMEADKNLNWLVSKMDNLLGVEPMLEQYKINLTQFHILLFLQNCPNGATIQTIKKKMNKQVTTLIEKMYQMNMVDYDGGNKEVITIDTMGLILVEQIISKL
jgi:hypothetical protein